MDISITFTGRTPLICHNVQMADPDNTIVQAIKKITSKRVKTEEDRREIEKLEWYGGLYLAPGIAGPAMPTANIRKCLIEGAKLTKQGTTVQRALSFADMFVPIAYEGPQDIDKLWQKEAFRDRRMVGVKQSRTARMRPGFNEWVVQARMFLLVNVMDLASLEQIAAQAGLTQGLGDNRTNGFGRFDATVVAA